MTTSIEPGLSHEFSYLVPENKTVPHLFPEAAEFQAMPKVLATGFMVGLVEWTCVQALAPHLESGSVTVGTHVNLSHSAATPPGLTVTVRVSLTEVDGKKLTFDVTAHDGMDTICTGTHDRFIVDEERFAAGIAKKQ